MTIQQSRLRKKTSKKSLNINKNILRNQKKSWPLAIIPLTLLKKRKSMTPIKLRISTTIKKATLLATALSQKTCINIGNLHTDD